MFLSETQVSTAMDYCCLLNNSCAIRGLLLILRERCKFRLGLVLRSIKKIPGTSYSFHFHICVITRMLGTKHSNNNQTVSLFKYHVKNVLSFHCVCVFKSRSNTFTHDWSWRINYHWLNFSGFFLCPSPHYLSKQSTSVHFCTCNAC